MNFNKFFILITAFILMTFAGCGGTTTNTALNVASSNANTANSNVGNSDSNKKTESATTNNAPTVAPVVQAYYDALKKKDDAAMKKVLSAEFLKSIEADMKSEKKTSIAAFMAETDIVPDKPVEVRNEKVDGNTAAAELKGGSYVNWTAFKFVKENGEWKLTNEFPDVQDVRQSANAVNKAK